jgi:aspartate kinase
MALLVQKFGGTSLANIERINHAADLVIKAKQAGHQVVVIVSAMAGETDRLIALAQGIQSTPSPREYAALVATGEQVTMALLAMALQARGAEALSMTGAQAGIHTCNQYKKARIQCIQADAILQALKDGKIVVIAGFQGVDEHGNTTTLGRGGSDTSAVAVAAAIHADECQIFTDVEGVFTTDPNLVPEAKRLESITFEEMLELASLGSKVLQIRSVEFAGKYNVPLRVLSSIKAGPGTLISYDKTQRMESPLVSGIAFSRQECKLTISGLADPFGAVPKILAEISALQVNIDMMVHTVMPNHGGQVAFMVHQDEFAATLAHFKSIIEQIGAETVHGQEQLAKLSLVGAGLKSHPFVASTLFNTLAAEHIHVQLMSMSEIKLSVVIEAAKLEEAVRALHQAFHLGQEANQPVPNAEVGNGIYPEESSVVYSEN